MKSQHNWLHLSYKRPSTLYDSIALIRTEFYHRLTPGDPIMLVYPPGLDFIVAFLACLRAGLLAVPVYPPRKDSRDIYEPYFDLCRPSSLE